MKVGRLGMTVVASIAALEARQDALLDELTA